MQSLIKDIDRKIVEIRQEEPEHQKPMMIRVRKWFIPNLKHILRHKFNNTTPPMSLLGLGCSSIVVKVGRRVFRIAYVEPKAEHKAKLKYEMDTIRAHDFGILAPIDYCFRPTSSNDPKGVWWYEIVEAYPYQGATLREYSVLLHKVMKLAKYGLFWNDIHNDNFMRDDKGNLVIVDFDTKTVDEWIKDAILEYKDVKMDDIKPWLDKFFTDWQDHRRLRFMIYSYLGIPITNENWMKFGFGEFMYRAKYHIDFRYPTNLLEAQIKYKGAIPF